MKLFVRIRALFFRLVGRRTPARFAPDAFEVAEAELNPRADYR